MTHLTVLKCLPSPRVSMTAPLEIAAPNAMGYNEAASNLAARQSATSSLAQQEESVWWYRPRRFLALLWFIMWLVYADTGLIASNGIMGEQRTEQQPQGEGMQGEFGLSLFQAGLIPAMLIVGLVVASLIFSELVSYFDSFRLVGVGMVIWTLGCVGTGMAPTYSWLLAARTMVGAGEASIITLSAPFIDDAAPEASKGRWFAVLSIAPPLGVALGYIAGGAFGEVINWRNCFLAESLLGVPVLLFCLLAQPVKLAAFDDTPAPCKEKELKGCARAKASMWAIWQDIKVLHQLPVNILNTYGNAPLQAVLGAYTFWAPMSARQLYGLEEETADLLLGIITIVSSVVGTLGGGLFYDMIGTTLHNGMLIQGGSAALSCLFCEVAFIFVEDFGVFCGLLSIGLLFNFVGTAPLYAVSMWSVPAPQRAAAQALLVVTMHALGDVPSPPLVGALQGRTNNWRITMGAATALNLVGALCYGWGCQAAKTAVDYRELEPLESSSPHCEGGRAAAATAGPPSPSHCRE